MDRHIIDWITNNFNPTHKNLTLSWQDQAIYKIPNPHKNILQHMHGTVMKFWSIIP